MHDQLTGCPEQSEAEKAGWRLGERRIDGTDSERILTSHDAPIEQLARNAFFNQLTSGIA
jgi:hypothetical protein